MAEAQTLTYDANEQAEGELSTEEKEALEVGEKLAEQQNELLAGKFKDAEELEKGYIELQKKLGDPNKETEESEVKEEVKEDTKEEVETAFLDTLWDEANDEFTKETMDKLNGMDPKDVAQMYLEYRSNQPGQQVLSTENVTQLKDVVGGEEQYGQMMQWANSNLTEKETQMYDAVMEQGNPLAAFFAVQALKYRFDDSQGVDGQMLSGKTASNSKGDQFRSQAEVVRAMADPKYDNDPAYRQDIYDKLERSKNLQF
jgi:hypothetical protein